MAHINLNSIRNKFEMLRELVQNRIDILLISETKINSSFPTSQFEIEGFSSPYRKDRSQNGQNGGGILLYIRDHIASKRLNPRPLEDIECLCVEIKIYKKSWLIFGTYNPNKNLISNHTSMLGKSIDLLTPLYDNIVILGDFNSEVSEDIMDEFCCTYNLKSLIKEATCFKNPHKPSCIDLILTNKNKSFQDSTVVETGLSDFHKLTITVLKLFYKKQMPMIVQYRDYKKFSNICFRKELDQYMAKYDIKDSSNDEFVENFLTIFNKHAPIKTKYLRANNGPFMTKYLRKAIMMRSKLKNKFNKTKTSVAFSAYKKQRNLCTSILRKTKKEYFGNLKPSEICDNKKFWKIVKPLFTDNVGKSNRITLVDSNEIHNDSNKIAKTFNDFFSNAVNNLNIDRSMYPDTDDINDDPVLNAIEKYKTHPSIIKIKQTFKKGEKFSFTVTNLENVFSEILSLNESKACPKESIPTTIIKANCDLFSGKILTDFNVSINNWIY